MGDLFLTDGERKIFDALGGALKEGWTVKKEVASFKDSEQLQAIRLSLVRVHSPALLTMFQKIKSADKKDISRFLETQDLTRIDKHDLAKLFFALGPQTLSLLIDSSLKNTASADDVKQVAALTVIRRSLLAALSPSADVR